METDATVAGEMALRLKVLAALPSSIASTHVAACNWL